MATELAKAYVQILPSAKGIKEKLKEELDPPAEKAGASAGHKLGSAITKAFAALGVGKAIGSALTEGMELEQNLGGTEAVFGKFAQTVQDQATTAYKNMGMSASEYMATANKMGSLFQGSGIAQQESLELTSKAMQRAADVASVMGIDMSMAMESIAGAAKGNFTMMDNLGVAMNVTTLEAYALEKGLNFKWDQASQAEKNQLAMQMFFERTAQYEGNFLRESTQTFSGALGAMKGAWADLLGNIMLGQNVAPALESLKTSVMVFAQQLIPAVVNVLSQLPIALTQMVVTLTPSLMTAGVDLVTQLMNGLGSAFPTLLESVTMMIPQIITTMAEGFPMLVNAGGSMLYSIVHGLIESVPKLIESIPAVITTVIDGLMNGLDAVFNTAMMLFAEIVNAIPVVIPKLVEALPKIIETIANGLEKNFDRVMESAISTLMAIVEAIPVIVENLIPALPKIIVTITKSLISATPKIAKAAAKALMGIVDAIPDILGNLMSAMKDVGANLVRGLFNGISDMTGWILDKISGFGTSVLEGIKNIFGIHSPATTTTWMGKMLDVGLAKGITGNLSPIKKAVGQMTDMTTGTLESDLTVSAKPVKADDSQLYALFLSFIEKLGDMKVVLDNGETIGRVDTGLANIWLQEERGVV